MTVISNILYWISTGLLVPVIVLLKSIGTPLRRTPVLLPEKENGSAWPISLKTTTLSIFLNEAAVLRRAFTYGVAHLSHTDVRR